MTSEEKNFQKILNFRPGRGHIRGRSKNFFRKNFFFCLFLQKCSIYALENYVFQVLCDLDKQILNNTGGGGGALVGHKASELDINNQKASVTII